MGCLILAVVVAVGNAEVAEDFVFEVLEPDLVVAEDEVIGIVGNGLIVWMKQLKSASVGEGEY